MRVDAGQPTGELGKSEPVMELFYLPEGYYYYSRLDCKMSECNEVGERGEVAELELDQCGRMRSRCAPPRSATPSLSRHLSSWMLCYFWFEHSSKCFFICRELSERRCFVKYAGQIPFSPFSWMQTDLRSRFLSVAILKFSRKVLPFAHSPSYPTLTARSFIHKSSSCFWLATYACLLALVMDVNYTTRHEHYSKKFASYSLH